MAHPGGLRDPAANTYMSILLAQQDPTSHPTCTHTLPLLSPPHTGVGTSRQPNSGIPKEPSRIGITVGPEADLKSTVACRPLADPSGSERILLHISGSHQRLGS
jgi:hypothetical protein